MLVLNHCEDHFGMKIFSFKFLSCHINSWHILRYSHWITVLHSRKMSTSKWKKVLERWVTQIRGVTIAC